ncbi:unnamed protein product [Peniophora sp. CBMAI 1063]|nr:unnamed protein product [Peniophora sp. CBMAI 1063]
MLTQPHLGTNSRAKAVRAKRDLGWAPTKGDADFYKNIEDEVAAILVDPRSTDTSADINHLVVRRIGTSGAIGTSGSLGPHLGTNSRAKAVRAKRDLGWAPTKGDADFYKNIEDEVAAILVDPRSTDTSADINHLVVVQ